MSQKTKSGAEPANRQTLDHDEMTTIIRQHCLSRSMTGPLTSSHQPFSPRTGKHSQIDHNETRFEGLTRPQVAQPECRQSAWKRAQKRSRWRPIVETAMFCQGRATWWW